MISRILPLEREVAILYNNNLLNKWNEDSRYNITQLITESDTCNRLIISSIYDFLTDKQQDEMDYANIEHKTEVKAFYFAMCICLPLLKRLHDIKW